MNSFYFLNKKKKTDRIEAHRILEAAGRSRRRNRHLEQTHRIPARKQDKSAHAASHRPHQNRRPRVPDRRAQTRLRGKRRRRFAESKRERRQSPRGRHGQSAAAAERRRRNPVQTQTAAEHKQEPLGGDQIPQRRNRPPQHRAKAAATRRRSLYQRKIGHQEAAGRN